MIAFLPSYLRNGEDSWLYRFLMRDVAWASTTQQLQHYMIYVAVAVVTVMLMSAGLIFASGWEQGWWLLIGAGFFMFILVDFAAIYFGMVTAHEHQTQLDLLRLTPVGTDYLVQSLHQVAHTCAWRVLIIMQAMRFTLLLVGFISTPGLGTFFVLFFGFLLFGEPGWRLQLMTAIALMAGLHGENTTSQWGTSVAIMLGIWLVHSFLALLPLWTLVYGGNNLASLTCFTTPLYIPIVTFVVWRGQTRARDWCLRRATRFVSEPTV